MPQSGAQVAPLDYSSRQPEILAILWTFTGLSLIVVLLRVVLRSRIIRSAGKDDFVVGLSMVSASYPPDHLIGRSTGI